MIFRLMLILSLSICLVPFAHADATSKLAKIHDFFKLTRQEQLTTQIMNQMMQQANSGMMEKLTGIHLTPEQQKPVTAFVNKVDAIIENTLSWKQIEPALVNLYSDAFTEQQMDDMLAFYKSPTGQAVIEKTPLLVKQSNAMAQQRLAAVMPELHKMFQDFVTEETCIGNQSTQQAGKHSDKPVFK